MFKRNSVLLSEFGQYPKAKALKSNSKKHAGYRIQSPEYLLNIIAQVAEVLLSRVNVPPEEALALTQQIKEKRMGELFTHFKGYDVQAVRWEARAEGAGKKLLSIIRKKMEKNFSSEDIAEMLEEDIFLVHKICNLIQNHPDWDDDAIYTELYPEKIGPHPNGQ